MINLEDLNLGGVKVLRARRFFDSRGWFMELCRDEWLEKLAPARRFVQDNVSWSEHRCTLRGLHAQRPPMAQAKVVTVLTGAIFDAVVDCRQGSPTYGQSRAVRLSADEPSLVYVPAGFCHGFLTLEPATTVFYKLDAYYSPAHEIGVRWNDPALGIEWPLDGRRPILSDKDELLPMLSDFKPL